MQQRSYGPTGRSVSVIGLGGAYLTHQSFADGVATVRTALDLGVTYFDTSPMYGRGASQAVVGEALDGVEAPHVLATKLGYFARPEAFRHPEALRTQFEENLRLLRRDRVDTLQLHEADQHAWWSDDRDHKGRIDDQRAYDFAAAPALAVLGQLKAEGRIGFAGISGNHAEAMRRVVEAVDVDTFLLAFNYDLLRRQGRRVLPVARSRGAACLVGAIFQRGLTHVDRSLLDERPRWMTPDLAERYRALFELQAQAGMSLATMGVRYMVAQAEPDVIIIGARNPDEIRECVGAAEAGPLPADLVEAIERI